MENNSSFRNLRELRGSGYEIMSGEPDIIGWSIRDTADRKLGVVHDLLFDPEQQKVRYIIAHLKDNDFDLDRRKVLIPIGVAQLHENNDNVILSSVNAWQIRALPTYDKHMTDQDEQDVYTIFSNTDSTTTSKTQQLYPHMYDHTNYNYDNLFKNRRKDRPSDKALGIRQREINQADNLSSPEYERRNEFMNQREEVPVRNDRNRSIDTDNDRNRSIDTDNDRNRLSGSENLRDQDNTKVRLIDRIRNLKEDLNEIERDLRNSREM